MKTSKEFNKKYGKNSLDVLLMLKIQSSFFESFKISNASLTEYAEISEMSLCKVLNRFIESEFIDRQVQGISLRYITVNELPSDVEALLYLRYKELDMHIFDEHRIKATEDIRQPTLI